MTMNELVGMITTGLAGGDVKLYGRTYRAGPLYATVHTPTEAKPGDPQCDHCWDGHRMPHMMKQWRTSHGDDSGWWLMCLGCERAYLITAEPPAQMKTVAGAAIDE